MPAIKKTGSYPAKDNLIIINEAFENKPSYGLSEKELNFISSQIKKEDKKLILLNRAGQLIALVLTEKNKPLQVQLELMRRAGSCIAGHLNEMRVAAITITCADTFAKHALATAEGLALATYQFIRHKTGKKEKETNTLSSVNICVPAISETEVRELNILVKAVYHARNLVNEPVNVLNAPALAKVCQQLGKEGGIKTEVFGKTKIEQLKMGGLLAVNKGSVDPPVFILMEYKPRQAKNKQPYLLVGKGVVYDTGGLSLKPTPNSMDMMKSDMAGAAAVAATMYAVALAKLPVHLIALIPATDNRPGGNAYAPGDIITMHDGSTVEMLNADAEGRMILADALSYGKRYKPCLAIELSTLTGSAAMAVGQHAIVSMGNASEEIHRKLKASGDNTYERLAEFPFWEEYDEMLKSDIADIKSIGGNAAGAITAGRFLSRFTDYPYLHLDIAGPAFIAAREHYKPKGATGCGVRLLFDFFKHC